MKYPVSLTLTEKGTLIYDKTVTATKTFEGCRIWPKSCKIHKVSWKCDEPEEHEDQNKGSQGLPHIWIGLENIRMVAMKLWWPEIGGAFRDPRGSHTLGNLPHNQEAILDQEAGSHRILGSHTIRNQESGIRNNITVTITVSSVNISASSYQSPPSPWCAAWTAWSGLQ